jgi:hypothetical protein
VALHLLKICVGIDSIAHLARAACAEPTRANLL